MEPEAARGRGSAERAASEIANRLQQAGHKAFFAGGCVRDRLLGLKAEDFDIATSATPEDVQNVFPKARGVGEFFGVILVYKNGWPVQVATFRKEGPYTDHRRPDHVSEATVEEDSARRDFTINGMYWDPVGEQLVDFHGGEQDLAEKLIRAIGRPVDRLEEDHLRMLRAVRFAARFGFQIEAGTEKAIREHRLGLAGISKERIGEEIRRMLLNPNRSIAAGFLESLGLAESVLGHASTGWDNANHLDSVNGSLPRSQYATALAAWALDRGLDVQPDVLASNWREQLMLSNVDRDGLRDILEIKGRLKREWNDLGVAGHKRLASLAWFESARSLLGVADSKVADQIASRVESLRPSGLAPPRLLGGAVLLEAGFPPGPRFSDIIEAVYDAQLEGQIHTPEEAMGLAKEIWGNPDSAN